MTLAEEYDQAQERGDAATRGGDRRSDQRGETAPLTQPDDVGEKDLLKEARALRDAEAADPGLIDLALKAIDQAKAAM